MGPKREPWGTPGLILWDSDVWSFTDTRSDLSERKDMMIPKTSPEIYVHVYQYNFIEHATVA